MIFEINFELLYRSNSRISWGHSTRDEIWTSLTGFNEDIYQWTGSTLISLDNYLISGDFLASKTCKTNTWCKLDVFNEEIVCLS